MRKDLSSQTNPKNKDKAKYAIEHGILYFLQNNIASNLNEEIVGNKEATFVSLDLRIFDLKIYGKSLKEYFEKCNYQFFEDEKILGNKENYRPLIKDLIYLNRLDENQIIINKKKIEKLTNIYEEKEYKDYVDEIGRDLFLNVFCMPFHLNISNLNKDQTIDIEEIYYDFFGERENKNPWDKLAKQKEKNKLLLENLADQLLELKKTINNESFNKSNLAEILTEILIIYGQILNNYNVYLNERYELDKEKSELGELIKTIFFNSIFKQKEVICLRTSLYDDYFSHIDNIIIDKETNKILFAIDITFTQDKNVLEKKRRLAFRYNINNGQTLIFSTTVENSKIKPGVFVKAPVIILKIENEFLEEILSLYYDIYQKGIYNLNELHKFLESKTDNPSKNEIITQILKNTEDFFKKIEEENNILKDRGDLPIFDEIKKIINDLRNKILGPTNFETK